MPLNGTVGRVCDKCFGGNAEAMRLYAEKYLRDEQVVPLGREFRDIIATRNRHNWWRQALASINNHLKILPSNTQSINNNTKTNQKEFRTIKALVFDYIRTVQGRGDYDELTRKMLQHFPNSRWKKTHWAWYRYQILNGRFKDEFSASVRANLEKAGGRIQLIVPQEPIINPLPPGNAREKGPHPRDTEVKRIGDHVLEHVRFIFSLAAKEDLDLRFRLNRWVFSRLMHDEIRVKRPIKKTLWNSGMRKCQACGESFASLKGVEIHRKSATSTYSVENCELLCRECHEQLP